jgi:uncharacterized protein (DUF488 family)
MELFTVGYRRWAPDARWKRLVDVLRGTRVDVVVDVRHSPCSSSLDPSNSYGPRDWHLGAGGLGLAPLLEAEGIDYRWIVELGNPQKNDPAMRVLREHLADSSGRWPVRRGIAELRRLIVDERKRCCLLCACADLDRCHRKLIVDAVRREVAPLEIVARDLSA